MVPVVEDFFYYGFYFCCWYININVFDVNGTNFFIFVYFCIFEIVNQVTRFAYYNFWALVIYCLVPWLCILLVYIGDCLSI
jgi:hypothetical protein